MLQLYDYQEKLVADIRAAFVAGNKAVLAVLPTGGGKTVVFSWIASQMVANSKKPYIVVHRIELLRQAYKAMQHMKIRSGLINTKYTPDFRAECQIAMIQTLVNRLDKFAEPQLIIIDEAHHAIASQYTKVLAQYPNAFVLGVTATPYRGDGQGLGKSVGGVFDTMVQGPQIAELIAQGRLVQPKIYRPPTNIDLTGVRTLKSGDYDMFEVEKRVDKPSITGDAVKHYRKLADGKPAVVFCVSVAHAEHVAAQFRAEGYRAYSVDGQTDSSEREGILKGLGNGKVQVVTSCDLISEGTDIPAIACAILLRPTQSLGLYLQQVGRALRTADGKTAAIILDHVGNVFRHGKPDDFREWTLEGEIKGNKAANQSEKPITVKQCEECYAVYEKAAHDACPECGHTNMPKPAQMPKQETGELIEHVDDPEYIAIRQQQESDAKLMGALRKQARKFGRADGWAVHKFNEIKAKEAAKKGVTITNNHTIPPYLLEVI